MQVPLQNIAEDWKVGNLSYYDAACEAQLQTRLKLKFKGVSQDYLAQKLQRLVS